MGDITRYPTGAVRSCKKGRGRFDLIPTNPLRRLAVVYEKGLQNEKGEMAHEERNWERGIPLSSWFSSMARHLLAMAEGTFDEDHPGNLVFNAFGWMETIRLVLDGKLPDWLIDIPEVKKALRIPTHKGDPNAKDSCTNGATTGRADCHDSRKLQTSSQGGSCSDTTGSCWCGQHCFDD